MAAKKRKGTGGRKAPLTLDDRYGHILDDLRVRLAAEFRNAATSIMQAGGDLADIAALEAKAKMVEAESALKLKVRAFRADVKKARRLGLFKGAAPHPSATAGTSRILKALDSIGEAIAGREKVVRVSAPKAKLLKKRGYHVVNNRVIISPDYEVTKTGHVQQIIPGFTQQRIVYFDDPDENDGEDIEDIIDRAFDSMNPDQRIVIMINHNHSDILGKADREQFKKLFFAYDTRRAEVGDVWTKYATIGIFKDRSQAFREIQGRKKVVKANRRAALSEARKARKRQQYLNKRAKEAATKPPSAPSKGAYLHSGKQGRKP